MTCARCGRANRPDARFCDACGAPLAARRVPPTRWRARSSRSSSPTSSARRRCTSASTPSRSARLMERYYAALRAAVEAHGGTVVKLLGDGVMAAFGVPRVGRGRRDPRRARRGRHAAGLPRARRASAGARRRHRPARRGQHRRGRRQRRPQRRHRRSGQRRGAPPGGGARRRRRDRRGDAPARRRAA